MVNVVIDTNVIVSAAKSTDGNPAQIFEMLLLEEITNFTTEEIIEEIKDVLARPRIKLNLVEQKFVLNNFEKFSKKISTSSKFDIIKDDPADNKFLECAVDSKADYIISGDNHLLKLKEFKGIKIITPAEFVKTHKNDWFNNYIKKH